MSQIDRKKFLCTASTLLLYFVFTDNSRAEPLKERHAKYQIEQNTIIKYKEGATLIAERYINSLTNICDNQLVYINFHDIRQGFNDQYFYKKLYYQFNTRNLARDVVYKPARKPTEAEILNKNQPRATIIVKYSIGDRQRTAKSRNLAYRYRDSPYHKDANVESWSNWKDYHSALTPMVQTLYFEQESDGIFRLKNIYSNEVGGMTYISMPQDLVKELSLQLPRGNYSRPDCETMMGEHYLRDSPFFNLLR